METLEQIHDVINESDTKLGILLAAQLGGTPQEIQMILQTADYDEATEGITSTGQYVIRAIGVREHRVSLGLFGRIVTSTDHPLLYRHNEALLQIYFRGQPDNVDALMIDISQLYGQTYGADRNLADEINTSMPLSSLLTMGHGFFGEMPTTFAQQIQTVFERHGLSTNFIESQPAMMQHQMLVMDDSYVIAQLFSADPLGN